MLPRGCIDPKLMRGIHHRYSFTEAIAMASWSHLHHCVWHVYEEQTLSIASVLNETQGTHFKFFMAVSFICSPD